jgi:hypothetical protein
MPSCYFLAVAAGSSVDQQSNNATLFNLVEQINVPPGINPKPGSRIPLEIHAYLQGQPQELGNQFEMRFSLVSLATGLETYSEGATQRLASPRLRIRTVGLPFPPMLGHYDLRVDFRSGDSENWQRDGSLWPLSFLEAEKKPSVTH